MASEGDACTRSASCRCTDCVAAMSMFTAKDLVAVSSSTVSFDDGATESAAVAVSEPVAAKETPVASERKLQGTEVSGDVPARNGGTAVQVAADEDEESDFQDLGLEELLSHENWKARKIGFEKLMKEMEQSESQQAIVANFEACLNEVAIGALDGALEAASAYVRTHYHGKDDGALARSSVPKLFKKALVGRPGTKRRATELCLDFMEVSKEVMTVTIHALLKGLEEKNPKVGANCLSCIGSAIHAFGGRRLPLQEVQNAVVQGSEVKNPQIRKEAAALAKSLDFAYKGAFRAIVTSQINAPATQKTLLKAIDDAAAKRKEGASPPTPKRCVRSEAITSESAAEFGGTGEECNEGNEWEMVDLFEALPERSILDKLEGMKFEKRLKEVKWLERKKAFAEVIEQCGTPPKLVKGDYTDLVRTIRGIIQKDSNQAVVIAAIQLLEALGCGLRSEFHIHAKLCTGQLLYRYRDKKLPLISAVDSTLDMFAKFCFNITEEKVVNFVAESLSTSGENGKLKSTPIQRANVISWLDRCFNNGCVWSAPKRNLAKPDGSGFRQILDHLVVGVADADPKVREHSVTCLSTLFLANSKPPPPEDLHALVKDEVQKVIAAHPKLEKKLKGEDQPQQQEQEKANQKSSPSARAKRTDENRNDDEAAAAPPIPPTSAVDMGRKKKPHIAVIRGRKAEFMTTKDGERGTEDMGAALIPEEEAEEKVSALGIEGMSDAVTLFGEAVRWQDKLQVPKLLSEHVTSVETLDQDTAHAIIVFIGSKTKGFKEPNFNIMNEVWKLIDDVVQKCRDKQVSRHHAIHVLESAHKKIGDKKQNDSVQSMVLSMCEACGPRFIGLKLIKLAQSISSPKALEDIFVLLRTIASDFGASQLDLKTLVPFCGGEKGLGMKQNPTKLQAKKCLAMLHAQVGKPIEVLLGEAMNDPLLEELKKMEEEIDKGKVGKRKQATSVAEETESAEQLNMDDLVPRKDVSGELTEELMGQLGDESSKAAWKVRMKAIDDITEILQKANNKIQLDKSVRVTMAELRKRLHDSNRNLVTKAVNAIAMLGNSVGGDSVVSLAKGNIGVVLSCLSDGKKTVVMAIENTLEQWTVHDGKTHRGAFFAILHEAPEALIDAKNDRKVVLQWTLKHAKEFSEEERASQNIQDIMTNLADPLTTCLQSRDPTVRKLASRCVTLLITYFGHEQGEQLMESRCRDLKPAVARSVLPLLKAAFAEADGSSANAGAPSSAAKPSSSSSPKSVTAQEKESFKKSLTERGTKSFRHRRPPRGTDHQGMIEIGVATQALVQEDDEPPFKKVNPMLRQKREERGRRKRWPALFDEKDKHRMTELSQSLREDFEKVANKDLLRKLFKDADGGRAARGSALDPAFQCLMAEIPNYGHESMECFDLLLKWSTLQLHNNNSTVTVNVLQLLEMMFELASGADYVLTDYEASAFIPHLLFKLGEKQKRFRDSVRQIMKLLCNCYPYSKYVVYVHAEVSPNQRSTYVLTECLDELARLARLHGPQLLKVKVGVGQNIMKTVVPMVGDSRKEVRAAALSFMEQIWNHEERDDHALYELIGQSKAQLSDKSKTLIGNHLREAEKTNPFEPQDVEEKPSISPVARKLHLNNASEPNVAHARLAQKASSPKTPDMHKSHKTLRITEESPSGNALFEVDLPDTPPSPSERKRHSMSFVEKENNPSSPIRSSRVEALTPPIKAQRPDAYVEMIKRIPTELASYEKVVSNGVLFEESDKAIRTNATKALASLVSNRAPPGWIEDGFGGQPEWIELLSGNIDGPSVLRSLLGLLKAVENHDGDGIDTTENAQEECRLLKLVLPAMMTLSWWPALRDNLAMQNSKLASEWVTKICDQIQRQMLHIASQEGQAMGSEASHELLVEQKRLLKTSQTIFAKLSESFVWLPAVLSRFKRTFEGNSNEHTMNKVLSSALEEYIEMQDSFVEPYISVRVAQVVIVLEEILSAGVLDSEGEVLMKKLVSSMLACGNRFTDHIPGQGNGALKMFAAKLLMAAQSSNRRIPEGELTENEKTELAAIFKRIADAIDARERDARDKAFSDLFRFADTHPGFDATQHLEGSSQWFRDYIEKEFERQRCQKTNPGGGAQAGENVRPLEESSSSLNVRSIRERLGKLKKDFVKKAPEPELPNESNEASSLQEPVQAAIQEKIEPVREAVAAAGASIESIRERLAARRRAGNNK